MVAGEYAIEGSLVASAIYIHAHIVHGKGRGHPQVHADPMIRKADLHVHSRYSGLTRVSFLTFPDSISHPSDLVRMAEKKQLAVLCITDHNSIRGALEAKKLATSVEIVTGSEILTLDGDLLGLFLTEDIPKGRTAEETIDAIHAQGGLAVAPHPFSSHCDSLGLQIMDLKLDGVELFNAAHRDGYTNEAAQRMSSNLDLAFVGGSDAHSPTMVGNAYTLFEGESAEDLRKAILARKTSYAGEMTPLKDLVWMTVTVTAELWRVLGLSLVGRPVADGTECALAVSRMRTISKVVGLMGATAFLIPPAPALVGVLGDHIHRSRSRTHFTSVTNGPKATQ
jgi:predicted metal-dependent phosphoesterase TrpH